MAISKNDSKEQIERLVENFDNRIGELKTNIYNETKTRRDFIDPFLFALGWDIDNKLNLSEIYREVIHEDKLKLEDSSRAPDYCLTIGGNKKFFIEAKKPSVNLKDSTTAAYQLRRYGWNAKMPISVITDFEEFSIYDCQVKPNIDDKATIARINYITYKDYLKEFDFLWETFSKESVKNGSLEKYFQSTKGKRASTSVDDEFLKSLDSWRDLLATDLVKNNPTIKEDELNFSIQKIIDRLIFLRIGEDRNIEDDNQLLKSVGINTYNNLKKLFHLADRKYNSGLFDYTKDKTTDSLVINDEVLKNIIEEMYYPKSPYEFSVIPVEILGHSYEQYLGKTISINSNHKIIIEEKPEVRKAGGVYYTPQYIVDYIVQNTVGKLVEGKKPEDVAKLKICDPACGSGSFLLGAYQYLLNWHREYYNNYFSNATSNNDANATHGFSRGQNEASTATPSFSLGQKKMLAQKEKFLKPDGNLTTSLKKEILLNNIFGVDIDTNAVEVTKLSLMLKAMEGETKASINYQLSAFHDRVLPTLDQNIKSGNSLIDMDFYESQIDFEPAVEKKIKPFSWEQAFPDVFKDKIIEENLQAIHVTWATHNSRISERMIRTHVKVGEPVWMTNEMRNLTVEVLEKKIIELELRVLALNVLGDHVHLLLVCNPDKLEDIIRQLKGFSSFRLCRELKLSVAGDGKQNKLWASGFSDTKIRDEHHLSETISYIENNHIKHGIEECNRRLQPSAKTSIADAFKPKVIKGGFDAVIGNPPYVFTRDVDWPDEIKTYYWKKFDLENILKSKKSQSGKINLYILFILQSSKLININGLVSYIIPNGFLRTTTYDVTRKFLLEKTKINSIVDLKEGVFQGVTASTIILQYSKNFHDNNPITIIDANYKVDGIINELKKTFKNQLDFLKNTSYAINIFVNNCEMKIFQKMNENNFYLKDITFEIIEGIVAHKEYLSNYKINDNYRELLEGKDIKKFKINFGNNYILWDRNLLHRPRPDYVWSASKKIITQRISGGNIPLVAAIDYNKNLSFASTNIILIKPEIEDSYNYELVCALINSKLLNFYYYKNFSNGSNLTVNISKTYLEMLPIPKNPAPETQKQIIKLVETMLQLNKDLQAATLPEQKEQIQQRINYTDKKIDQLVYQLYDLTEEEIKVVEGE